MDRRILILAALMVPALGGAESLGDAAKKEKARRAAVPRDKASTVVTEETLGSSKGRLANDPGQPAPAPAGSSGAAEASPAPPPAGGGGEAYWRGRMKSAEAEVSRRESVVAELNARATELAIAPGAGCTGLNDNPRCWERDAQLRTQWEKDRAAVQIRLDDARRQLERAQKALADLPDEARRAGALPGWLR